MVNVIFEVPRVTLPLKSTYPNHLSPRSTSYLTIPLLSFYLPSLSFSLKHLTSSLTTELEWPSMPQREEQAWGLSFSLSVLAISMTPGHFSAGGYLSKSF